MKIAQWIIIGTLSLFCFFLYQSKSETESRSKRNVDALNSEMKTYKNKLGQTVSEKKALEISRQELKHLNDSLQIAIKRMKPEVIVKWRTRTVYDTTYIQLDSIPCKFSAPFSYEDEWLAYNGVVSNKGLRMDNITTYNKQSIVFGKERKNFFHPYYTTARIVNDNPNIEVRDIQSYKIKQKKRIYDKWYFWLGIGLVGGRLIVK
jgi:hypothetical protein